MARNRIATVSLGGASKRRIPGRGAVFASLAEQEAQLLEPVSESFRGHGEGQRGAWIGLREALNWEDVSSLSSEPAAPTFNVRQAAVPSALYPKWFGRPEQRPLLIPDLSYPPSFRARHRDDDNDDLTLPIVPDLVATFAPDTSILVSPPSTDAE